LAWSGRIQIQKIRVDHESNILDRLAIEVNRTITMQQFYHIPVDCTLVAVVALKIR